MKYYYSTLAKYYDILEDNSQIKEFNKVLGRILKKRNVRSVLDISCGTGNQSIYLHKKGYRVTASDLSKEMIRLASEKYPKIKFRHGDMRTTKLGKFDVVISIFNSIGHLSRSDFEKAIRNISRNLKPGGYFVFDIFNFDFMKNNFKSHEFIDVSKEVEGVKYVRFNKNSLNKRDKVMKINQKIYIQENLEKPRVLSESWDMKIYSSEDLRRLLERNGFEVERFLDMSGKRFDKENSLFILSVGKKKK